jgi:hypothetical protein
MAEAAEHHEPAEDPSRTPDDSAIGAAGVPEGGGRRSRIKQLPEGHLPVTEVTFDRAGAASPFGDDQTFPLPVDQLLYTHSTTP